MRISSYKAQGVRRGPGCIANPPETAERRAHQSLVVQALSDESDMERSDDDMSSVDAMSLDLSYNNAYTLATLQ